MAGAAWKSLVSALAGLTACVFITVFLGGAWLRADPFTLVLIVVVYCGPMILTVWLLLLWPLYGLVPRASVLWRPSVCVPCGAGAGLVLMMVWLGLIGVDPREIWRFSYWPVGSVVGAVTCAAGSALKETEPPSGKPALVPVVHQKVMVWWRQACERARERFDGWAGQ